MRKDSKDPKSFLKDEDGVSPVIGVILMVAITVILAAVVAGFVFGAIDMPGATPTASISVDSVDDGEITLVHDGGDTLAGEDTRITVTYDGDSESEMLEDILDNNGDDWSTGERVIIEAGDNENDGEFGNIDDVDGEIEIRVIDDPSGGTISVRTVTATWNINTG